MKILLFLLILLVVGISHAVLPPIEEGYDSWSSCNAVCNSQHLNCERACSQGTGDCTKEEDPGECAARQRNEFWSCARGGCDGGIVSCKASCNSWTDVPIDKRPDADAYRNWEKTRNCKDSELVDGCCPGEEKADFGICCKKGEKASYDKAAKRLSCGNSADENGEGCPRFCSGSILMENGRKDAGGTCWYNPTRCSVCESGTWPHCGTTEEEYANNLKLEITKKQNQLQDLCRTYALTPEICANLKGYSDASSKRELQDLNMEFNFRLLDAMNEKKYQDYEKYKSELRNEMYKEEHKVFSDLQEKYTGRADQYYSTDEMLNQLLLAKFDRDNPDFGEGDFAIITDTPTIFKEIGYYLIDKNLKSATYNEAKKVMNENFKTYLNERMKGEDTGLSEDEAHKAAIAKVKEGMKDSEKSGLVPGYALAGTVYDTEDYGKVFSRYYKGVKAQVDQGMIMEYDERYKRSEEHT
ncbi:MAG: hypothetical protein HGA85_07955, partial [Nanoarchaeota archaeon]|nr:hypothetical protein [Nanoarchaeota archaeon]